MRKSMWCMLAGMAVLVTPAVGQEAPHAAAPGPLTVEGGLVIWTLVVFGLLVFIMGRSAWPVLLQAVRERERSLERLLTEAAQAREEAARLLEEHKKLLAGARAESQALLNEAREAAEKEREAALKKTHEEQDQVLDRARKEIQSEKERAITSLRREAVDLSLAAASKLLEEKVDTEANRKLVSDYLAHIPEMKH